MESDFRNRGKGKLCHCRALCRCDLRHRPHTIRLFIHAPEGFRRQRAVTSYGLAEGEAAEKVRTINEERARHYKKYTGGSWGSAENYHLSVDRSLCGVEDCAKLIGRFRSEGGKEHTLIPFRRKPMFFCG